jgi:hypothetical protein
MHRLKAVQMGGHNVSCLRYPGGFGRQVGRHLIADSLFILVNRFRFREVASFTQGMSHVARASHRGKPRKETGSRKPFFTSELIVIISSAGHFAGSLNEPHGSSTAQKASLSNVSCF